jgi:hypothetical protein
VYERGTVMTFDCEHCQYMIEYLDPDKWSEYCRCGRSIEDLAKLDEQYWKEYKEQMTDIKPCPCCGREAYVSQTLNLNGHVYGVRCTSCLIKIDSLYTTEEEAIRIWNETVGDKK